MATKPTKEFDLDSLRGKWSVKLTPSITLKRGAPGSDCWTSSLHMGSAPASAIYNIGPDRTLVGDYCISHQDREQEVALLEWQLRLRRGHSDIALVGFSPEQPMIEALSAFVLEKGMYLLAPFHDGCSIWEEMVPVIWKHDWWKGEPSLFSVLIRWLTEDVWVLDLAVFIPSESEGSDSPFAPRICRIEHLHERSNRAQISAGFGFSRAKARSEAKEAIAAAREEVDSGIGEIESLIDSLSDTRDELERKAKALDDLIGHFEQTANDLDWAESEFADALFEEHRIRIMSGCDYNNHFGGEAIESAWHSIVEADSQLDSFAIEAESLHSDVDIDREIQEVVGVRWTNAEFRRGQELVRTRKVCLEQTDLGFLADQKRASQALSSEALAILQTAAFLHSEIVDWPEGADFGIAVAQMEKCCERLFSDAFLNRRDAIQSSALCRALLNEPKKWEFACNGPVQVDKSAFCKIIKLVKKDKPYWSGLSNCVNGLMLFGGMVTIRDGVQEAVINPLGIVFDGELVRSLPSKLIELHGRRNGFVHHDRASREDAIEAWICFEDCARGLLQLFYAGKFEA